MAVSGHDAIEVMRLVGLRSDARGTVRVFGELPDAELGGLDTDGCQGGADLGAVLVGMVEGLGEHDAVLASAPHAWGWTVWDWVSTTLFSHRPHTRGGGPYRNVDSMQGLTSSPHAWGWTA